MPNSDWLPKGRDAFYDKAEQVTSYTDLEAERFGMDKTTRIGDWYILVYHPTYNVYIADYATCKDPTKQTPALLFKLKMEEEKMRELLRELYNFLRGNPLVTAADLEAMGLPPRPSKERHPSQVETEPPAFDIEVRDSHRLAIYYYPDGSTRKKGKPKGQHGAEFKWDFMEEDKPVLNPENLAHSLFDTASPLVLAFNPEDHGRLIGIAARWENNPGIKGPWSEVRRAYIP
jgi:hypothetical protein